MVIFTHCLAQVLGINLYKANEIYMHMHFMFPYAQRGGTAGVWEWPWQLQALEDHAGPHIHNYLHGNM